MVPGSCTRMPTVQQPAASTVSATFDHKRLLMHLQVQKFWVESGGQWRVLHQGVFLTSVDITDAYLHILTLPPHQSCVWFVLKVCHVQICGLAVWPVYSSLSAPGFWVYCTPYSFCRILGHLLLREQSTLLLEINVSLGEYSGRVRMDFGFTEVGPVVEIFRLVTAYCPGESNPSSGQMSCAQVALLRTLTNPSIHFCMRVMGKMVASLKAVPFIQFSFHIPTMEYLSSI